MNRNCRTTTVGVTKLFVGAWLAELSKSEFFRKRDDFAGLENGHPSHASGNRHQLGSDKLSFSGRETIFEQHLNDFPKIDIQFVKRLFLGVAGSSVFSAAGRGDFVFERYLSASSL